MLIVIEGLDGAGKRTLGRGLEQAFEADGRSVTTLAFPRYGDSVTADLASEALHGRHACGAAHQQHLRGGGGAGPRVRGLGFRV